MKIEAVFEVEVTLEVPDDRAAVVLGRPMRPEWQASLYDLDTVGSVVTMLGRCVGVKNWNLAHMDGWADCGEDWIQGTDRNWECIRLDIDGVDVDPYEPYDFGQDALTPGQCTGEEPVADVQ